MRHAVICAIALALGVPAGPAVAQQSPRAGSHANASAAAATSRAESEIRQAEEQMHRAYVDHDTALFASLYADDATFTYSRGELVGKDERVKRFNAPFVGLQDMVQKIRIYDDVAIVNALSTYPNAARTRIVAIQITRVWQKRNGRWQVVAFQSTPTQVPESARVDQPARITFAPQ